MISHRPQPRCQIATQDATGRVYPFMTGPLWLYLGNRTCNELRADPRPAWRGVIVSCPRCKTSGNHHLRLRSTCPQSTVGSSELVIFVNGVVAHCSGAFLLVFPVHVHEFGELS